MASAPEPPEPARELAGHFLRAAAGFSRLPSWMEHHALTAMSPTARQRAWAVGRRFTGNPDHGFAIAERVPAEGIGSLWPLFRSAPDLATVHALHPRVAPLLVDGARCTIEEGDRSASIAYAMPGVTMDRAEEDARALLAVKTWRALHGVPIAPRSVHFGYARPRATRVHERMLGTRTLQFGAPRFRLELDLRDWRRPLPSADAEVFARELRKLERELERLAEAPLDRRVDGLLTELLSTDARAERVAEMLGLGVRTLHRRLAHAGASFRELAERARRREDGLFREANALFGFRTLSERDHAHLLGFAGGGALRNALRRWAVRS